MNASAENRRKQLVQKHAQRVVVGLSRFEQWRLFQSDKPEIFDEVSRVGRRGIHFATLRIVRTRNTQTDSHAVVIKGLKNQQEFAKQIMIAHRNTSITGMLLNLVDSIIK